MVVAARHTTARARVESASFQACTSIADCSRGLAAKAAKRGRQERQRIFVFTGRPVRAPRFRAQREEAFGAETVLRDASPGRTRIGSVQPERWVTFQTGHIGGCLRLERDAVLVNRKQCNAR